MVLNPTDHIAILAAVVFSVPINDLETASVVPINGCNTATGTALTTAFTAP
jgi:hypothetical protein